MAKRTYRRISYEDRLAMENWLKNGEDFSEIARKLGCCELTVVKEFNRGRMQDNTYSAIEAQKKI